MLAAAVMLVAGWFLSAAPVSAGTLSWSAETIPSTSGYVLNDGDVVDLAVSTGGDVIYSCNGTEYIYRSSNRGESWSIIHVVDSGNSCNVTKIAVAPDDENYIAAAGDNISASVVFVSDDAGANWDILDDTTLDSINALALSVAKGGKHFVSVAGVTGAAGKVNYYEIGAVGASWVDASAKAGFQGEQDIAGAVEFSPNFASDEVMVAVSYNQTDAIYFQIFSFDQAEWNGSAGFTDYPVTIVSDSADASVDDLDSASISLSPDYLGSDDSMRLAFVGLVADSTASADNASGIFRLDDDDVDALKEKVHIYSVDYDGTNLVAGRYDTTTVYRSADPLASSPSVKSSAGLKSPGGEYYTVVGWSGTDVVAGTTGDESAFAVSTNNGKSFNDISLIDTTLTVLSDVAVSADGSNVYLVSADGTPDMSLWRYASAWERVLSDDASANDFIVRTAPDDMDAVYVADRGGTTIYYSTDAGEDKWHTRISTYTIGDLAIEAGGSVCYVAEDGVGGYVSKSTNSGFTWATKKSSKLTAGISMLTSLGEDLLLAGSNDGKAAYSKDGNVTWSKLADGMTSSSVQVIADGLDEGDLVWAATSTAGDDIYRWDWDDEEWDDEGDTDASFGAYGIALQDGVLYVLTSDGTDSKLLRSLNPTADDPDWNTVDETGDDYSVTPSALKVSVSGDVVKLWAIDIEAPDLVSYKDTIAIVGPTLISPKLGYVVPINPVTGEALMVTFSWERPSDEVDGYDLVIAYDSAFDETVRSYTIGDDSDIVSYVAQVTWNPDTTYYWRVRVDAATDPDVGDAGTYGPVRSPWSETRSFRVEALEVAPAVEVAPTPEITIEVPPPPITIEPPEIVIPPVPEVVWPTPEIVIPPALPPPPASFAVSDLSVTPSEVKPTEQVTISALVSNTGGSEGSCTVVLKINGAEETKKEVTLGAGKSETVTFTTAKEADGTYVIDVHGLSGTFMVKPTPAPAPVVWVIVGVVGSAAVAGTAITVRRYVKVRHFRKEWQEKAKEEEPAREEEPTETCQPCTRDCRWKELELEPALRKIAHLSLSACDPVSSEQSKEERVQDDIVDGLNKVVAARRHGEKTEKLQEQTALLADALLKQIIEWLHDEPVPRDISIVGHLAGGKVTYQYILYHCKRRGNVNMWEEEEKWKETVEDKRDERVGALRNLDPTERKVPESKASELTRLLMQFIEKV